MYDTVASCYRKRIVMRRLDEPVCDSASFKLKKRGERPMMMMTMMMMILMMMFRSLL